MPSGDQVGRVSPDTLSVNRVNPDPSRFTTKTWDGPSRLDTKAIRVPSGDKEGYASALGWLVKLVTEPSVFFTKTSRFPPSESTKTTGLVGVGVRVAVGVAVGFGVGVAVGLGLGVTIGLAVRVGVAVGSGSGEAVGIAVNVGVSVGLGIQVAVLVGTDTLVGVASTAAIMVGVSTLAETGVTSGAGEAAGAQPARSIIRATPSIRAFPILKPAPPPQVSSALPPLPVSPSLCPSLAAPR